MSARRDSAALAAGLRGAALLAALALLGACSWFGGQDQYAPRGPSIAEVVDDLPALALPDAQAAVPTREEVMAAYERVYGAMPDARENRAVGKRLGDLRMSVGEDRDIAGEAQPYRAAIELYESLLDDGAAEGQDQIVYQLARAYDLSGDTDRAVSYLDQLVTRFPDSPYVVEGRFRRAEIAFSREQYQQAADDYGYVVDQGRATPYWQNANYMRGWSLFKRSELDGALASFFTVIDDLLAGTDEAALAATDRELLKDSFRVVTLTLGYLDGPASLAEQMRRLERPHWQYLAYQTLAQDYVEKERYLDSVATWQTFIDENPLDARAPAAHIGMIKTLTDADFPSEIRPKKEMFVRRYGIFSEFWSVHDDSVRASYIDTLKAYLSEVSKLAHADAQKSGERSDFLAAAAWYEELVATIPDDPAMAEYLFLLGEVYTEADEPGRAVAAYQRVVREFPEFPQAHEAGYAAILGLDKLTASAPPDERELWQRLKIDAQIEFAFVFAGDPRAPAVQTDAADNLFKLGDYAAAVEVAENLLSAWPDVDWSLRRTALLVSGHGLFELGRFAAAESYYRLLLAGPLEGEERDALNERLLATVYRQGEEAERAGNPDAAVAHYLRLRGLDAAAELTAKGHYDAVAVLESSGRTAEAAALLAEFRELYPDNELGRDVARRLAAMYEQTGDLAGAAAEYVRLSQTGDDPEVRRQSLYRAAELYLSLDELDQAVGYFRDYAHTYEQPADLRLEAMNHLDALYQRLGDPEKRRFWLRQKIELHAGMGRNASERATFLAAEAQFVLAEDERAAFEALRLSQPLKKSLKRKQEALKRTVKAYEATAAYKVAQFATASTFHIADLYASLSTAIMQSDRPAGLSELELEQYDILLEEQAFPFEEQAISLHEINMRRSWEGEWDEWIEKSFVELGRLMPARFDKQEVEVAYVETIY
ncbi:MAG: tetratricopeptide repeat protein [Pseudomonadales bacterium]